MSKTEIFIEKARAVHGDKFNYSRVEYLSSAQKVCIICSSHGEWEQTPNSHLMGRGCKQCASKTLSVAKRSSTEDFITKATAIHGVKYDYSRVDYLLASKKVCIICREHGVYEVRPNCHLKGHGCKPCGVKKYSDAQRFSVEEFIEKATAIHGDKYDYSRVDYINSQTKICITCRKHGLFEQMPNSHLAGSGCRTCYNDTQRSSTEEFIAKATKIHGDTFDYSKAEYRNSYTKISIICRTHGVFKQSPQCHLNGRSCAKCQNDARRFSNEEFIEKSRQVHGSLYDYSKCEYTGSFDKVVIICQFHGEFHQQASNHLYGYGCNKCGDNATADARRFSVEDFIKRARSVHGEIYHYNNVVYTTAHEKIEIICKNHGSFKQKPSSHLDGSGCPNCKHKTEEKVLRLLRTRYPTTVTQFKQEWCRRIHMLPYDFCIPNLNIIIELDGLQHFQQVSNWGTPEFHFENDKYKEKCANSQQFSVVRITQNDAWNDTYDWLSELTAAIDEIKALPVGEVCNKYLCKNGEYDAYK